MQLGLMLCQHFYADRQRNEVQQSVQF